MDDAADLGRAQVIEKGVGVGTHKNRAVLAGQHTAVGRVHTGPLGKLTAGVAPVHGAVDHRIVHPDPAQLAALGQGGAEIRQLLQLGFPCGSIGQLCLGGGAGGLLCGQLGLQVVHLLLQSGNLFGQNNLLGAGILQMQRLHHRRRGKCHRQHHGNAERHQAPRIFALHYALAACAAR